MEKLKSSSSDEYQQSDSTEDQDNQDNPPISESPDHNHVGRDKRSVEGDAWKLFPPTNTTGAWLFGK